MRLLASRSLVVLGGYLPAHSYCMGWDGHNVPYGMCLPCTPTPTSHSFELEEWSTTGSFFESMEEAREERAKEDDRAADLLKRQKASQVRCCAALRAELAGAVVPFAGRYC
jgi:hypothetical protein